MARPFCQRFECSSSFIRVYLQVHLEKSYVRLLHYVSRSLRQLCKQSFQWNEDFKGQNWSKRHGSKQGFCGYPIQLRRYFVHVHELSLDLRLEKVEGAHLGHQAELQRDHHFL